MDSIQNLSALVTPSVVAIFDEANMQFSTELKYTKLGFTDYSPTFDTPAFQDISGTSEAVLTLEGNPYSPEDNIQDYRVSVTLRKYTKLIKITEETVHWIQAGNKERIQQFRSTVRSCANSLNQKVDIEAAKIFYLGFGTTFQAGGDGLALFSKSHTSPDPNVGVQSNVFSDTHRPLLRENLTVALQSINRFQDIRGVQLQAVKSPKLIVARENEENAKQILFSSQGPLTANLGMNPMYTGSSRIQLEVAEYIPVAYATYWFLVAEERQAEQLYMLWAWKPRMNDEYEYSSGVMYKAGSVYFKPIFTNWRWAFGSKGDSTAT